MKEPMFSVEKDPDDGLRIVVTRPDRTRVVIRADNRKARSKTTKEDALG